MIHHAVYFSRIVGRRINEDGHRDDYNEDIEHHQRIEINQNPQITNCLTSVQKDNMILEENKITIYDDFNHRVKSDQTCIGTVMPNFKNDEGGNRTKLISGDGVKIRVRRLTPKECWRLMGFTDEDFMSAKTGAREIAKDILRRFPHEGKRQMDETERLSRMSNTQLYKQAGNSIVVDVLCAIMLELYNAMPYLFEDMVVGSFFSGIGAFEKALSTFDSVRDSEILNHRLESDELTQIGYINDYNGDANRIYDGSTVARALKAEAGGVVPRLAGTQWKGRFQEAIDPRVV